VTLPEDLVGPPRRVVELVASRARIVAAADETRRRLHRDLHDGAQQRLVHAVIALKLARDAVDPGSAAAALVEEALAHAERASRELREVVRTVLPGSLMYGGLRTGLESLVADVAVRHSSAQRVEVEVRFSDETLVVEVSDDGTGGADAAGAGLTGLRDRVDTAGGSLTISSPPGTGTTVRARLPAQPREDAATQP
jgi:signal transduction histidine kinase